MQKVEYDDHEARQAIRTEMLQQRLQVSIESMPVIGSWRRNKKQADLHIPVCQYS